MSFPGFLATEDAFQIENTKLQTTDASAPVLWSKVLPASSAWYLKFLITGVKSDGSNRAGYKREVYVYAPSSGTAAFGGDAFESIPDYVSDNTWTAPVVQVSGTDGTVQVLAGGKASTTINWRCRVEICFGG